MNNLDYYNFDSNCNSGSTLDSIINGLPLDDLADALLSNANNPNNQFTYCDGSLIINSNGVILKMR